MGNGNVYKIVNLCNGKTYVGCTVKSLTVRFKEHIHRCQTKKLNTKLCNSFKKYGIDNFKIFSLVECEINEIYEIEKEYILKLNTYEDGLNCTMGGEGCLGYKHSDEIRFKISTNLKDGNSHKGKTYYEIYGDNCVSEKLKRKSSVKDNWDNMSEDDRRLRVDKITKTTHSKSKIGVEKIREIKEKINQGLKNKELKLIFPDIRVGLFSEIRTNKRWKTI